MIKHETTDERLSCSSLFESRHERDDRRDRIRRGSSHGRTIMRWPKLFQFDHQHHNNNNNNHHHNHNHNHKHHTHHPTQANNCQHQHHQSNAKPYNTKSTHRMRQTARIRRPKRLLFRCSSVIMKQSKCTLELQLVLMLLLKLLVVTLVVSTSLVANQTQGRDETLSTLSTLSPPPTKLIAQAERHRDDKSRPLTSPPGGLDEDAVRSEKEARLFQVAAELMMSGRSSDDDDDDEQQQQQQRRTNETATTTKAYQRNGEPRANPPGTAHNENLETATVNSVIELTSMRSVGDLIDGTTIRRPTDRALSEASSNLKSVISSELTTTTTAPPPPPPRKKEVKITSTTQAPANQQPADSMPDFLRDDLQHETDKLSHLAVNIQQRQQQTAKSKALDSTGWRPSVRAYGHEIGHNNNNNKAPIPVRPKPTKTSQRGGGGAEQDRKPARKGAKPPPTSTPTQVELNTDYLGRLPANSLYQHERVPLSTRGEQFQSQLQPQHVSPPAPLTTLQQSNLISWAQPLAQQPPPPPVANFSSPPLPPPPPFRFAKSSRHFVEQQQQQLKAAVSNLLPRLAAKLFSGVGDGKDELLNQQQSHLFATHQSSLATLPTAKLTPEQQRQKFNPVKSIFMPQLQPQLQPQQSLKANAKPRANLILMNGQVYSVLNHEDDLMQQQQQQHHNHHQKQPKVHLPSIFDHQTSDTSDFPIFEAISQNAHNTPPLAASTWSPIQQDQQQQQQQQYQAASSIAGGQAPMRCDRPRHIIQADRTVVNHILASEQNFVIARVPIKKFARTNQPHQQPNWAAATNAATLPNNYQQQQVQQPVLGFQGALQQSLIGQHQFLSMQPSVQQTTGYLASSGLLHPQATTIQYQSSAPTTTIEVSSGRGGLFHSIAQLIGNLRNRRPATIQPVGSNFAAASGPMAQFAVPISEPINGATILTVDGPVLVASSRGDPGAHESNSKLERLIRLRNLLTRGRAGPRRSSFVRQERSQPAAGGILDHSAFAASIISSQFNEPLYGSADGQLPSFAAAASNPQQQQQQHHLQLDPMRRLLMLKTSSDNEVCSPIGEIGAKIKYSCVPNSCVVSALANAARGLGLQPPGGIYGNQQQQQQMYANTDQMYKMSNSQRYEQSGYYNHHHQRPPPVQVTYTHLNAYQSPPISRLVQPQHQQFVSSSQVLDSLDEPEQQSMEEQSPPPSPAQAYEQSGPGSPSTRSPDSVPHLPQLTFGTAYVRPSAAPTRGNNNNNNENFVHFDQMRTSVRPNGFHTTRSASSASSSEDYENDDPTSSMGNGPNEFASAVDEQLERPIRVDSRTKLAKKLKRLRQQQQQRRRHQQQHHQQQQQQHQHQHQQQQQQQLEQREQVLAGGVENGGSSAENAPIENAMTHQLELHNQTRPLAYEQNLLYHVSENRKQRRLAPGPWRATSAALNAIVPSPSPSPSPPPPPPTPPAQFGYVNSSTAQADDQGGGARPGEEDEEDAGEEEEERDEDAEQEQPQRPMNNNQTWPGATLAPADLSMPIAIGAAHRSQHRRHKSEQPPAQAAYRYGQRQLTSPSSSLPPPEKATTATQFGPSSGIDDTTDYPSATPTSTTECDCSTTNATSGANRATDETDLNDLNDPPARPGAELEPRERLNSGGRQLVAGAGRRQAASQQIQQGGQVVSSKLPSKSSSIVNSYLPKDRRQTPATATAGNDSRPLSYGPGPLDRNYLTSSTKRPYNLRNTTYKNLLLTNTNELQATQLSPPQKFHHQSGGLGGPESDLSTTTASNVGPAEPKPAHFHPSAESSSAFSGNNLTQFDDSNEPVPNNNNNNSNDHPGGGGISFKPSSVNDILALARREQQNSPSLNNATTTTTSNEQGNSTITSKRSLRPRQGKELKKAGAGDGAGDEAGDGDGDGDEEENEKEKDVTPHQYQIQLRWSGQEDKGAAPGRSSLSSAPSSTSSSSLSLSPSPGPGPLPASGNVDKLGERVRDRLFEHREEEHWHERDWVRASHKASPSDPSRPAPLADPRQLDYGPHERETPVRDQLPNAPSEGEVRQHFAVPTRNFRQSPEFVEWAQRDVNLNEWPGEPKRSRRRTRSQSR